MKHQNIALYVMIFPEKYLKRINHEHEIVIEYNDITKKPLKLK